MQDKDQYSYKGSYKEAVVFVFLKDDKLLIEKRPSGPNHDGPPSYFYPSGKIEIKDHESCSSQDDYRVTALYREVNEEFNGKITFDEYCYLGEIAADAIKINFYIYLITSFEGCMPTETIENGKKFADLFWICPEDQKQYFIFDTAFAITDMVEKHLNSCTMNKKP